MKKKIAPSRAKAAKPTPAAKPAPAPKPAPVAKPAPAPKPLKPAKKSAPPVKPGTTFSVRAEAGCSVFVAGTFNSWSPSADKLTDTKGDGTYTATLDLTPGEHQYKFVIDGAWCADPENKETVFNEHGTLNSVIRV